MYEEASMGPLCCLPNNSSFMVDFWQNLARQVNPDQEINTRHAERQSQVRYTMFYF